MDDMFTPGAGAAFCFCSGFGSGGVNEAGTWSDDAQVGQLASMPIMSMGASISWPHVWQIKVTKSTPGIGLGAGFDISGDVDLPPSFCVLEASLLSCWRDGILLSILQ